MGELVVAEPLLVLSFPDPALSVYEQELSNANPRSGVRFALVDYLALRWMTLLGAVQKASQEQTLPYAGINFVGQMDGELLCAERCDEVGQEITYLEEFLRERRSGIIFPTTRGPDVILFAWDAQTSLVVLVQNESGTRTAASDGAFLKFEPVLSCHLARVVFRPLEKSRGSPIMVDHDGRMTLVLDKSSWKHYAPNLELGIANLKKFTNFTDLA